MSSEELDYDETGLDVSWMTLPDEASASEGDAEPSQPVNLDRTRGIKRSYHQTSVVVGPRRKKKARSCPLCDLRTTQHVRRHLLREHLPWYVLPDLTCRGCKTTRDPEDALEHTFKGRCHPKGQREHGTAPAGDAQVVWSRLMNGMLRMLCLWLRVPDFLALMALYCPTVGESTRVNQVPISPMEEFLITTFDKLNGIPAAPGPLCLSPPTDMGVLVHWHVVTVLCQQLSPSHQGQLRNLMVMADTMGRREVEVFRPEDLDRRYADAHFHLRDLLRRARVDNLDSVPNKLPGLPSSDLAVAISNFCWLGSIPTAEMLKRPAYQDQRVYFTVGIHPLMAAKATEADLCRYREALCLNRVVGAGEMGLDYSSRSNGSVPSASQQAWLLHRLLDVEPIGARGLPIVIHCREGDGDRRASHDLLEILQHHLPPHTRIHFHCFMGDLQEAQQWMRVFPNVYFGFSPKILEPGREQVLQALWFLDMGRVLLESDSPYIVPPCPSPSKGFSSPKVVGGVAKRIAEVKGLSLENVLTITLRNCRAFYRV